LSTKNKALNNNKRAQKPRVVRLHAAAQIIPQKVAKATFQTYILYTPGKCRLQHSLQRIMRV